MSVCATHPFRSLDQTLLPRVQAGILDNLTKHAFLLATKLGRNEYNCFPDSPGYANAQSLLHALQTLTLEAGDGDEHVQAVMAQLHAELQAP